MPCMRVEPLTPDDAPDLLDLARLWGAGPLVIHPQAHGAVVRKEGEVQAYALLRETSYGYIVDELWCRQSRPGRHALSLLADWLEATVARLAAERNLPAMPLGGVCRLDNPAHYKALEGRGYAVVAHVFAKDIPAARPVEVS